MDFVHPQRLSLKAHPSLNEKWLQQQLVGDASLLGLGELDVKAVERRQPKAGRLDLLLSDPENLTRYEVEIQLGPTDESHIIRTIEYWDIERRRFPQYDHVAVIVAEDITSRFLNVIGLFNGFIPLIAIQIQAVQVGESFTLVATTVMDVVRLGAEEEDEGGEATDRSYWERKASPQSLAIVDAMMDLVRRVDPRLSLTYRKVHVGLARDGVPDNFVLFHPRKQNIVVALKIARSEELTTRLEEAGVEMLTYNNRFGRYRIRVAQEDLTRRRELLEELVRLAHSASE